MKSYETDWQRKDETITTSKGYFEHLLNCLANQKFVGELPTNGDALATGENEYRNIQKENQTVIDKAWKEGMFILTHNGRIDRAIMDVRAKYITFVEKNSKDIDNAVDLDFKEFNDKDKDIDFKWMHLVPQEIMMWISLCCSTDAIIDSENEKYEVGQVKQEDFIEIIKRRGFTPRMISFLKEALKGSGIGDNL